MAEKSTGQVGQFALLEWRKNHWTMSSGPVLISRTDYYVFIIYFEKNPRMVPSFEDVSQYQYASYIFKYLHYTYRFIFSTCFQTQRSRRDLALGKQHISTNNKSVFSFPRSRSNTES